MSEQPPVYHSWFHKFLIWFALWAFAAFALLYGLRHILRVIENEPSFMALEIILSALLMALGAFIIWTRFDLAAMRKRAIAELTGACAAAAVLSLAYHWVEYISAEDCHQGCVLKAIVFACWGVALYRYYRPRKDLFRAR